MIYSRLDVVGLSKAEEADIQVGAGDETVQPSADDMPFRRVTLLEPVNRALVILQKMLGLIVLLMSRRGRLSRRTSPQSLCQQISRLLGIQV